MALYRHFGRKFDAEWQRLVAAAPEVVAQVRQLKCLNAHIGAAFETAAWVKVFMEDSKAYTHELAARTNC